MCDTKTSARRAENKILAARVDFTSISKEISTDWWRRVLSNAGRDRHSVRWCNFLSKFRESRAATCQTIPLIVVTAISTARIDNNSKFKREQSFWFRVSLAIARRIQITFSHLTCRFCKQKNFRWNWNAARRNENTIFAQKAEISLSNVVTARLPGDGCVQWWIAVHLEVSH